MASNLKDIYVGVKKNDEDRNENDLYATPPMVSYILQKYVAVPTNIVEPCAGRGNIAIELTRCGHNVIAYDLNKYENSCFRITTNQDVLKLPRQEGFDGLVTNPPYFKDLPRKIAEKSISEYDFTALFVRLTFLEGMKRYKIFTENPPSDILIMSDRVKFKEVFPEAIEFDDQIGGMISYMWIIWNKKATHQNTKLQWILLKDEYDEWKKHYEETK